MARPGEGEFSPSYETGADASFVPLQSLDSINEAAAAAAPAEPIDEPALSTASSIDLNGGNVDDGLVSKAAVGDRDDADQIAADDDQTPPSPLDDPGIRPGAKDHEYRMRAAKIEAIKTSNRDMGRP